MLEFGGKGRSSEGVRGTDFELISRGCAQKKKRIISLRSYAFTAPLKTFMYI
jgi:hypothetical protein